MGYRMVNGKFNMTTTYKISKCKQVLHGGVSKVKYIQ